MRPAECEDVERSTMNVSQRAKLRVDVESTPHMDHQFSFSWFALQTRSRHEKLVHNDLQRQEIETFLPTIRRLSQWKDRKKTIDFPLFAGYCFARFSLYEKRLTILQSPGVVRIVGSHGYPEPIPDHEIQSLQILSKNRHPHETYPFLKEGMLAEIVRGPLQGVTGRLVRHARQCRLVLSISLIQQAVAVEVDAADVMPAAAATA